VNNGIDSCKKQRLGDSISKALFVLMVMIPGWLVRNQSGDNDDQNGHDHAEQGAGCEVVADALHRAHDVRRHLDKQKRPEKCPKQAHYISSHLRIIPFLILS